MKARYLCRCCRLFIKDSALPVLLTAHASLTALFCTLWTLYRPHDLTPPPALLSDVTAELSVSGLTLRVKGQTCCSLCRAEPVKA